MAENAISVRHRVQAIDQLDQLARHLNAMAAWLGERGLETESDMVNESAKSLLAACWWMSRPLRPQPAPTRWTQSAQRS